tara:strand:- start:68 stop:325 length:258 start_codon:yes stop_codon:yes gene_type:complete
MFLVLIKNKTRQLCSQTLIIFIRFYQIFISPLLGSNCRFHPTCSAYFIEAVKIYGPRKGFVLGVKRISKCHPWGGKGIDNVPEKE